MERAAPVVPASTRPTPASRSERRAALAAGLTYRPLADTAADTLAWLATRPADYAAQVDRAANGGWRPNREGR